jgi:nitroreductase
MEKRAATDYEIDPLLARRWSPRAFSERTVDKAVLCSLFEAARWAPSCFNEQPWSFLLADRENAAEFDRLASCLSPGNHWARRAPVLMLSVAALDFAKNSKPNRHAYHDVGLAVENLVIQATAMGLVAHQMAGFDVEKAREVFRIPARHDPVAMIALGYPGDPDSLPEDLRKRELAQRSRKPIRKFVYSGHWGESAAIVS